MTGVRKENAAGKKGPHRVPFPSLVDRQGLLLARIFDVIAQLVKGENLPIV